VPGCGANALKTALQCFEALAEALAGRPALAPMAISSQTNMSVNQK
jgi:hypothetical protein